MTITAHQDHLSSEVAGSGIPRRTCTIEGCDARHYSLGYCSRHYQRVRRHGDTSVVLPRRSFPAGDPGPAYKGDEVGYRGVHSRLYKTRGKAAEQVCKHCGVPAQEWAYDHLDPDERTGLNHGREMPFSLDVEHYIPLCIPCHRSFDAPS